MQFASHAVMYALSYVMDLVHNDMHMHVAHSATMHMYF